MINDNLNYNYENVIGNELQVLNSFLEFDEGTIGSIIDKVVNNWLPVYEEDIWKHAQALQDWIEQALQEGIAETSDLTKVFQAGYKLYYEDLIFQNLDLLLYDYASQELDYVCNRLDTGVIKTMNLKEVGEELKEMFVGFTAMHKTLADIRNVVSAILFEELRRV